MGTKKGEVREWWTAPPPGHRQIKTYVDVDLWDEFKEFCRKENRVYYQSINQAIKEWMENEDRKTKEVLKELRRRRHSFQLK